MSITVRLWNKDELKKAQKDEWLATLLMNKKTFNNQELLAYHTLPHPRREFDLIWREEEEETTVFAPNVGMLKRFICEEYEVGPDDVFEHKHQFIEIDIYG